MACCLHQLQDFTLPQLSQLVRALSGVVGALQIKLNNTLPYLVSNIVEVLEVGLLASALFS